jgi:hypothetical protein
MTGPFYSSASDAPTVEPDDQAEEAHANGPAFEWMPEAAGSLLGTDKIVRQGAFERVARYPVVIRSAAGTITLDGIRPELPGPG